MGRDAGMGSDVCLKIWFYLVQVDLDWLCGEVFVELDPAGRRVGAKWRKDTKWRLGWHGPLRVYCWMHDTLDGVGNVSSCFQRFPSTCFATSRKIEARAPSPARWRTK